MSTGKEDSWLQDAKPVNGTQPPLCALHFDAAHATQVSWTHYSNDLRQCAMFDSSQDDAGLIAIENIVTDKIFKTLPDQEKSLWHFHDVSFPGIPDMKEVARTYGRVFRFSQKDGDNGLPLGLSQLVTSFKDAGHPELASDLEKRYAFPFKLQEKAKSHNGESGQRTIGPEQTSHLLEEDIWKEDVYLDDAVHRPSVHHLPSHLPALTERLPEHGRFLSETRSAKF